MIAFAQNLPTPPFITSTPSVPIDFQQLLQPVSEIEKQLLEVEAFKFGLNWGIPRFGHPEGKVGFHIAEVLANIQQVVPKSLTYDRLRLTAFVHDTFKYKEEISKQAGNKINHGLIARRFMEAYIDDVATLDLIELHDEIYFAWRHEALQGNAAKANTRLEALISRIGKEHFMLHYLFFRCDTMTGDKIQAPKLWIEQKIAGMQLPHLQEMIISLNQNT